MRLLINSYVVGGGLVETLTFAIVGLLLVVGTAVYIAFWIDNFRGRVR
jgi:hypothetical protein